jgi:hypothetical protein
VTPLNCALTWSDRLWQGTTLVCDVLVLTAVAGRIFPVIVRRYVTDTVQKPWILDTSIVLPPLISMPSAVPERATSFRSWLPTTLVKVYQHPADVDPKLPRVYVFLPTQAEILPRSPRCT